MILALLLIWIVFSFAAFSVWIHGTDHRDFYPIWAGARLNLLERQPLYSIDTVEKIQTNLYGHILPENRDQQGFAYPAQLVVELLPFWFIQDVEIATAIWEGLSALMIISTLSVLSRLDQKVPTFLIACLFFWYYTLLMLFQGQFTAIPLTSIGFSYWGYRKRKDLLSGSILAFGFIKPELVLLPAIVLLISALKKKRKQYILSFLFSGMILFIASTLISGWWIPSWIEALRRYSEYAQSTWAVQTAWNLSPLFILMLFIVSALAIKRALPDEHVLFTASVPLGMLLFPQTLIWGLTLLTIPLVLQWQDSKRLGVMVIWLLGWISAFLLSNADSWKLQTLILPVATLLLILLPIRASEKEKTEEISYST